MRSLLGAIGWLALVAVASFAPACKSSTTDCTCPVEQNGERRTLACGESACVGSVTTACGDDQKVEFRGACAETPPAGTTPPAEVDGAVPPIDHSCDDLRNFCSGSCNSPASVAADCQSTASAGDPQSCASWQSVNGILCKP